MAEQFTDFSHMPSLQLGEYEHYKGKRYRVLGVGCDTETQEYYVVYTSLDEHDGQPDIWLRPYDMFCSDVEVNGRTKKRFTFVGDQL